MKGVLTGWLGWVVGIFALAAHNLSLQGGSRTRGQRELLGRLPVFWTCGSAHSRVCASAHEGVSVQLIRKLWASLSSADAFSMSGRVVL